ncbi:MAG: hypothetical protein ACYCYI_11730 [Saccharofermentanales bacterium]
MFVGPFFYINEKIDNISGLYADLLSPEDGENDGFFINHPLSHADLFDRLKTDIEYMDVPRGRVLFDIKKNINMIYVDPSIESHISEITALFDVEDYIVGYDFHYTIIGKVDEWDDK